jgi:hypothetical protein
VLGSNAEFGENSQVALLAIRLTRTPAAVAAAPLPASAHDLRHDH